MKTLHVLKARWLLLAMVAVTTLGEIIAWQATRSFGVRFAPAAVAAVCVGLTAAVVAWLYDGHD
jgi:uncharacterized membrane-anchored protein